MKNVLLILLMVFIVSLAYAQGPATPENEKHCEVAEQVWAMEEAYVAFHRDANHEGILLIWHDQFLGWPDPMPSPTNKEAAACYTKQRYSWPGSWTFKIERAGIRVLGNVAINHYIIHWWIAGGVKQKASTRVTHTWIKEGS